jgi:signal transduction histidine kinase
MVWNSTSMLSWTLAGAVYLVLSICMVWTSGILQTRLLNTLSDLRDSREKITSQNISLIKEIEDRKELEKQKKEIEKQLFQSQKLESIGTLAGGIAHDFNNILTPIIGYTELVLYDVEKGTRLENNLQEIYIAAKRAKDLVKQIFLFARQSEEAPKPVQVDLIAKEAMKLLRSSIPTSVEIQQHIKSSALIMGNPTQVHQIFMNLCTNAAHAMENDGGIMEVRLTDIKIDTEFNKPPSKIEPGNYIQLSVSDTGTGIPAEVIESIFEPYFTTKESGQGTGMGLATVTVL